MNGAFTIKAWQALLALVVAGGILISNGVLTYAQVGHNAGDVATLEAEYSELETDIATIRASITSIEISMNYMKEDMEEMKLDLKAHLLRGEP